MIYSRMFGENEGKYVTQTGALQQFLRSRSVDFFHGVSLSIRGVSFSNFGTFWGSAQ